jgi:hypothetical protein
MRHQMLERQLQLLGEDHADLLQSMVSLALKCQGKHVDAERMYCQGSSDWVLSPGHAHCPSPLAGGFKGGRDTLRMSGFHVPRPKEARHCSLNNSLACGAPWGH